MAFANPFKSRSDGIAARAPVRRREMPIVASDEARHYGHVATLPCQRCGAAAPSQVAHSNALADGKARGMKAPWWMTAALCPVCHTDIDSGASLTKRARREAWVEAHRLTVAELFARGLVRPT